MKGLEKRLQAVDGVEAIELELGDEGLEGITVRLAEGADEALVLDGVRRLLVAYGTKTPRTVPLVPGVGDEPGPEPSHNRPGRTAAKNGDGEGLGSAGISEPAGTIQDDLGSQSVTATGSEGEVIELAVSSGADETTALVALGMDDRVVRRQVPASARAIVQAVIDAGTEITGREPVSVIGLNVSTVEKTRILTVILGNQGTSPKVCTATVVGSDWAEALMDVLLQILARPSRSF